MMNKCFGFSLLLVFVLDCSYATTRYWRGTTNSNWNVATNWNTIAAGGGSTGVPTTTDDVVFTASGLVNCMINTNVTVKSITVQAGYTNTITQASGFTFKVTGASVWSGGTFIGGNSSITNTGTFTLSGTNFTSTSSTFSLGNNFSFTSGTFSHNGGTVMFDFTLAFLPISVSNSVPLTFNNINTINYDQTLTVNNSFSVAGNMTLNGTNAKLTLSIASGQTISVAGTLSITGSNAITINSGSINASGDVTVTNSSTSTGGSGTISVVGSGTQTLTGSGTIGTGSLPNVTINKPSGTLNLSSIITCNGPAWTYISGTISPGTSTVCFYNTGAPYTISGTQTLNNVYFNGNYSTFTITNPLTAADVTLDATTRCDVTVSNSMTVTGTLTILGSDYYKLNTGTINVQGNVVNNNTSTNGGGTASFVINGSGTQTITGTAAKDQGAYPPFTINKPSGTLNLSNYLTFYFGFTWTAGTVNPGTSTCVFYDNAALGQQTITASAAGMSFYNILFEQTDSSPTKLATNISLLGNFTIAASCGVIAQNNDISIGGDFTNNNTTAGGVHSAFNPGTGTVTLNGTGLQTITTNNPSAASTGPLFYNLVINNTAARASNDDITLADILTVTNSITFTNGKMLTTASKYLSLQNGVSCNTGNSSSYVNGPMRYAMAFNGSRTLNFPIGDSGGWRYVTLSLTHNAATSYTYTSQVIHSSPSALGYTLPPTITHVSDVRYTEISRTVTGGGVSNANLSGNQQITMRYDIDDFVNDYAFLTIAKSTGTVSPWVDIGGVATANGTGTITSTSSPTAFTSFSYFTLANRVGGSNVLPIELISFEAKARPQSKSVELVWQTASEINNDYFKIEKSRDGLSWETLDEIKGAGNSTVLHRYSISDLAPHSGRTYYRLNQIDFDGHSSHSTVTWVEMFFTSVYPNPTRDRILIETENIDSKEIKIITLQGADVTPYVKLDVGEIDVSALPSQTYILKVGSLSVLFVKE